MLSAGPWKLAAGSTSPPPHQQFPPPPDTPAPRGGPAWPNSADTELRLPDPEPSILAIICKKRGQSSPGGAAESRSWGCPRRSGSFTGERPSAEPARLPAI